MEYFYFNRFVKLHPPPCWSTLGSYSNFLTNIPYPVQGSLLHPSNPWLGQLDLESKNTTVHFGQSPGFVSWVCYLYISVDLDTLFKESDFVSAHTALTPETAGNRKLDQELMALCNTRRVNFTHWGNCAADAPSCKKKKFFKLMFLILFHLNLTQ